MADTDTELRVVIRAEFAQLRAAMDAMKRDTQSATDQAKRDFHSFAEETHREMGSVSESVRQGMEGIKGPLEGVKRTVEGLAAVLAGGALFREALSDSQEFAFSVERVARVLGISTQEASGWVVAAKLANVAQESMQTSLIALARTLTTNQAALERNKVEFKDLHGALLPLDQIFQNTIHRYGELKAGNDQAMFAVQVFKRAVGQMPELQRLAHDLDEGRRTAEEFGLVLGTDGVTQAREFEAAVEKAKLGGLALGNEIASALRPEITGIAEAISHLVRDGTLTTWAREAGGAITALGGELRTVGTFLANHALLVGEIVKGYIAYRGALVGLGLASLIGGWVSALGGLSGAIGLVSSAVATLRGGTLGLSLAWAALTTTTGGLNLIVGALFATLAAGVSWWAANKVQVDALKGSMDALGTTTSQAAERLSRVYNTAVSATARIRAQYGADSEQYRNALDAEATAHGRLNDALRKDVSEAAANRDALRAQLATAREADRTQAGNEPGASAGAFLGPEVVSPEVSALEGQLATAEKAYRDTLERVKTLKPAPLFGTTGTDTTPPVPKEGAANAAFKALTAEMDAKLAAEKHNAEARLAIVSEYTTKVAAEFGEESEQFQAQKVKQTQAEEAAKDQRLQIATAVLEREKQAKLASVAAEEDRVKTLQAIGALSTDAAIAELSRLARARLDIARDTLAAEAALRTPEGAPAAPTTPAAPGANPVADETGKTQDQAAQLAEEDAQRKLQEERVKESARRLSGVITDVFNPIGQAFDRTVQGMIQGTLRFKDAVRNAGLSIVSEYASMGVKMVANWGAGILKMVAASVLGESLQTTAKASGEATREGITRTSRLKEVFMSAKTAAANAYSAMSGVPYVGPVLGAAAAVAVFAAVLALGSFKQGGDVPDDMLAQVHKDEMVLPQPIAEMIRQMAAGGGSTQAGMLAALAPKGTAPAPEGGAQPFLSSAGGLDRVPSSGALIQAHPDETVLSKPVADTVRDAAATPSVANEPAQDTRGHDDSRKRGDGEDRGGGDAKDGGKGGGHGRSEADRAGIPGGPSAAAITANVPFSGGGSGGGDKVQRVNIVEASKVLDTKAKGGTVETTASGPVPTTPADGVTPVQNQNVQPVTVQGKVPVSFTAIQAGIAISASAAPLGIGAIITGSFGTITAFKGGGDVPDDMLAKLHAREMVLPQPIADSVRSMASRGGPGSYVGELPPEIAASVAQVTRAESSLRQEIDRRRESDRSALVREMVAQGATGGDHYEFRPVIHSLDTETLRTYVDRHGDVFAAPVFQRMNRSNRGLRVRR